MITLNNYPHSDSILRLVKILNCFSSYEKSVAEVVKESDFTSSTVYHYITLAKNINYLVKTNGDHHKLTNRGIELIQSQQDVQAKILFDDFNNIVEINEIKKNPNLVVEKMKGKGFTDNGVERSLNTLKSLSNQTSSIKNIVNALNGELSHNGYNTTKKKTPIVKTWYCECGMVNAPAVQECDMCGEEKPELENAA